MDIQNVWIQPDHLFWGEEKSRRRNKGRLITNVLHTKSIGSCIPRSLGQEIRQKLQNGLYVMTMEKSLKVMDKSFRKLQVCSEPNFTFFLGSGKWRFVQMAPVHRAFNSVLSKSFHQNRGWNFRGCTVTKYIHTQTMSTKKKIK